jgi:hypothetical protein
MLQGRALLTWGHKNLSSTGLFAKDTGDVSKWLVSDFRAGMWVPLRHHVLWNILALGVCYISTIGLSRSSNQTLLLNESSVHFKVGEVNDWIIVPRLTRRLFANMV